MDKIIGIIGGFGAYATLDFQDKIFKKFKGDSERSFPHIICDNNFQMPSRTRALLTGENYDVIVHNIVDSMNVMLDLGVDYIVLPCGTAHYYLNDVYKYVPNAKERVLNIIDCSGEYISNRNIKEVLIVAAEGALKKNLYRDYFMKYNIKCIEPLEDKYKDIRYLIEIVKNDNFINIHDIGIRFAELLKYYGCRNIVLGCAEFPVLVSKLIEEKIDINEYVGYNFSLYDPFDIVIEKLYQLIN